MKSILRTIHILIRRAGRHIQGAIREIFGRSPPAVVRWLRALVRE